MRLFLPGALYFSNNQPLRWWYGVLRYDFHTTV